MIPARVLLVAIGVVFASSPAMAEGPTLPDCQTPAGAERTSSLDRVPNAVRNILDQYFKEQVVNAGADFDVTDVVSDDPPHFVRFIFAWRAGDRWLVAVEHGGYAYSDPVLLFAPTDGGIALAKTEDANPYTLCATATQLLLDR